MIVDLAFDRYGEPGGTPALVVLHGLLGAARNWTTLAKRFAEHRLVLAADLRNHGRSPWADGMSYAEMAEDVARLIERAGIAPAALLGHSMGGKVAMAVALLRPDLVERLVVVDIAPVAHPHGVFLDYIQAMRALDLAAVRSRTEADRVLAETIPDGAIRSFLLLNLDLGSGAPRWRANLDVLAAETDAILDFPADLAERRWDGPTLFVTGGRSDYVQAKHRDRIRALFPAARLVGIPRAGHWLHAERPEAFRATVEAFLPRA